MAIKDLLLKPHNVNDDVWWYEGSKGIEIYVRVIPNPDIISFKIPWGTLKTAVDRRFKV